VAVMAAKLGACPQSCHKDLASPGGCEEGRPASPPYSFLAACLSQHSGFRLFSVAALAPWVTWGASETPQERPANGFEDRGARVHDHP